MSGCAALVKALNPAWGYHEIKEHLLASCTVASGARRPVPVGRAFSMWPTPCSVPSNSRVIRGRCTWSSLNDAMLDWKLRYRAPLCVNVVALFRPHGDAHWRELAVARAGALKMTIPASALRRSLGHAAHRVPRVELLTPTKSR